ncbi:MAG TPA: hypothetical protein VGE01_13780 [Fimbriimonas sp.]
MGERFVKDDTSDYVETEEYVTEPSRPAPGMWLAGLVLFASLAAALWFWYQAETHVDGEPIVLGNQGPKIITESNRQGRYILVREGNTSRIVGGTAVAVKGDASDTSETVNGDTTRAETIASYKTQDIEPFAGPSPDMDRVGQTITIENGRVHEATGDKTFSLHSEAGKILMVFFPEPNTRAGEASVKIIGGDQVSVTGVLREMPSREQAKRLFGLSDREAGELTNQRLYIDAYRVVVY